MLGPGQTLRASAHLSVVPLTREGGGGLLVLVCMHLVLPEPL